MDIKGCTYAFFRGICDSFRGTIMLLYLDKEMNSRMLSRLSPTNTSSSTPIRNLKEHEESKVLKRVLQCCALNGGIFLLSIAFFDYGFLKGFSFVLNIIFGTDSLMKNTLWSWMFPILTFIFQTTWVTPLFLLTRIVSSLWFQDIADTAYKYTSGTPQFLETVSKLLADCIFSMGVEILFLFQAMLVRYIPIDMLGYVVSVIHMCLLYSLYAFEYKWFNMNWKLHQRLAFIENNWPYFIGFGLPLAILTDLSTSLFINGGIFSILFPLFILSANGASPVTGVCDYPLHLFSPVIILCNTLLSKVFGQRLQPLPASTGSSRR